MFAVTSFGPKCDYAKPFIESFIGYWPIDLIIYHEDQDLSGTDAILRNLFDVQDMIDFLDRHKSNRSVKGRYPQNNWKPKCIREGYNFRFDAYKFSRKIFAIADAAKEVKTGKLFWLDADIITREYIDVDLFDKVLPDDVAISYLDREPYHSECGFVGYNLDHPQTHGFIQEFARQYSSDEFLKINEWHDSYVFDFIRKKMDIESYAIPYTGRLPVEGSILGDYIVHDKGDRKHVSGR